MNKYLFFTTILTVSFLFVDANAVNKSTAPVESRIEKTFKKIDANSDGKISTKEYSDYEKATFARRDKNSDGVMVREEFAPRHYANQAKKGASKPATPKKTRAVKEKVEASPVSKSTSTKVEAAKTEMSKKASEVKKITE
jgi:hypothetical protein